MTIYVDTNVVYKWRDMAALDRVALSIVAAETQQAIVVPSIVMDETEAHLIRRLRRAASQINEGQDAFNELFDDQLLTEPPPDISMIVQDWRSSLLGHVKVVKPSGSVFEQALRREIHRIPPAQAIFDEAGKDIGATGARDSAIWLAIVEDHLASSDDGHFITADNGFTAGSTWKPELLADLESTDRPLTRHKSIFHYLQASGELSPTKGHHTKLDETELEARAGAVVRRILALTTAIPHAVFGAIERRFDYGTFIHDARVKEIRAWRRYDTVGGYLIVVDSVWRLNAGCFRTEVDGGHDDARFDSVDNAWFEGGVQLYLPTKENEDHLAQLMSGRMRMIDPPPG